MKKMMLELIYSCLNYKFGNFYLCKINGKLVWTEFEKEGKIPFSLFKDKGYILKRDDSLFERERMLLEKYFIGEIVDFSLIPIDFIIGTEAEKKVWIELLKIPYGKTVTYSFIAERIGIPEGYRFVGNAVGKNPIPIIVPCHRVIRKNGSLGGFSAGLYVKKYLLEIESASKF
ncbi:MAG: methylated-DNA--[protein]-cysteine S-methyltransferase [Candidatus Aminicenantia bacterium]